MKIIQRDLRVQGFTVSESNQVIPLFTRNIVQEAWHIPNLKSKWVFSCNFPICNDRVRRLGFTKDTLSEIRTGLPGVIKFGINDESCFRSYK